MLMIYGIKNCNTMKKAFDFLNEKGIVYEFFDYKKQVLTSDEFVTFTTLFGKAVINKQGMTYRKFDDETKVILASDDPSATYGVIKDNQSVLKRPILVGQWQGKDVALIGFDGDEWGGVFV